MDPRERHSDVTSRLSHQTSAAAYILEVTRLSFFKFVIKKTLICRLHRCKLLPEEEEKAAADQLHLQALLDVAAEEPQQFGDVGER